MRTLASLLARLLLPVAVGLLLLVWSGRAEAYPWMIRHDYTGCAMCHSDPSGGGLLTEYGRGLSEVVLRTRYTKSKEGAEEEAGTLGNFAFGVVPLPEQLQLGGSYRGLYYTYKAEGAPQWKDKLLHMQADLRAHVKISRFRAYGSIGYMPEQAFAAAITHAPEHNIVSREHWLGVDLGEDNEFLLRAGRMYIPFGIRNIEHVFWQRMLTRTDINDTQQHGVAFAYSGAKVRGELMLIAGNFQVNPDAFRERGYAGYLELAAAERLALGIQSLFASASKDAYGMAVTRAGLPDGLSRHAHGVFGRYSPVRPLVLSLDADFIAYAPRSTDTSYGYTGTFQADVEPLQGVHLIGTAEAMRYGGTVTDTAGWLSAQWFFLPHADVRADLARKSTIFMNPTRPTVTEFMAQIHFYL